MRPVMEADVEPERTRFRVLVGYEFTAENEAAAYARMVDYVTRRNEASDAFPRLTIGPPGATVTVLEGALTDAERRRIAASERSVGSI